MNGLTRMLNRFVLGVAVTMAGWVVSCRAAEVKSNHEGTGDKTTVRALNPIADLVSHSRVLDGHHYRGLTVFPVQIRGRGLPASLLTLDDALARGAVLIREKGQGQVPVLVVENRCGQYVFLMAGEILVGGKQNRILREDVLLPPHSGPIELPAYCVERGRWVKTADGFRSDGNFASARIRVGVQKGAPQSSVWHGIAETARDLKQESETGDFNYVYNQEEVARKLRDHRHEFFRAMPGGIAGIVVARNGCIVGADLFSDASLFMRLRRKVLDSYIIDALNEASKAPIGPDRHTAEQFLRRVLTAEYWNERTPGAGTIGRAVGNWVDAKGLIWNHRAVHVSMFPAVTVKPVPVHRDEQ